MTRTQSAVEQMVSQQVRTWDVLDARTLEVMQRVPREPFVPEAWLSLAYADCALPLPCGKHMLTPMLVGRILQALAVRQGEQVLEIGTGSGYLSACLASLGGRVQSLELHGEIAALARANLRSAAVTTVEVTAADGAALVSETAYDAIVLTASLPIYEPRFERALKYGGRLFVVVGSGPVMEARLVRRLGASEFSTQALFETSLEALENVPVPPAFRF
ncbi:MAG: protein-L-isoaspartate O-methyltransferase [Proteobacteria bacterium]|nr:protein-L-isoaspartate O-methyltransferase [Pseudomonadota bacterium]